MIPKVSGYRILRELGRGGMGMVYLARRESDDIEVALKILSPHRIDPTNSRRFQREGRVLKGFNHPNIVKVYEVEIREGNHYLVMQFIRGRTLSYHIKNNIIGFTVFSEILFSVVNYMICTNGA